MKIDSGGEAFLLESVEHGEKWGRYSFIGASTRAIIKGTSGTLEITEDGRTTTKRRPHRAFGFVYVVIQGRSRVRGHDVLRRGSGIFFSYDAVRYIEKIPDIIKKTRAFRICAS